VREAIDRRENSVFSPLANVSFKAICLRRELLGRNITWSRDQQRTAKQVITTKPLLLLPDT